MHVYEKMSIMDGTSLIIDRYNTQNQDQLDNDLLKIMNRYRQ
jgi:hypothetical protein